MTSAAEQLLPGADLRADRMPGHWLLARMGKRVLRPGGRELTNKLLAALDIRPTDHVVELAPGLGSTTNLVLARNPASYLGVDRDPVSAERVGAAMSGPNRRVIQASASETGAADASTDVVFGEAYLTMQPAAAKTRILAELARITKPGGRFGIHEIALVPDSLSPERVEAICSDLGSEIHVNVSPLAVTGWKQIIEDAGFEVRQQYFAPLHLLEPRRLVADEGLWGAIRFASRVARNGDARRRVLAMRSAMRRNASNLQACSLVAVRRED